RRHELLRATFAGRDGVPVQLIREHCGISLPVEGFGGLAPDERDAETQRRVAQENRRPFDLGSGPLFRAALVRLDDEEHLLLLTLHHIVSDGWSNEVLLRELGELYAAFRASRKSSLPELAIQYADYAAWQREWLQGEVLEERLAYWREHLAGAPALLELPTARRRPSMQTF